MGGSKHFRFLARTVLVKNNDVDTAYKSLDRILRSEKILEAARRQMYYEKPFLKRSRLAFERSKRIYDSEMQNKIEFLMRKNRPDAFLR